MDNDGNIVHSWATDYTPGNAVYLLEDGKLLYTGGVRNATFRQDGAGGIVLLIDWDGNVTWEYRYSNASHLQHHDVEMLPNGNVLMIAWQMKTEAEAIAAGRDPSLLTAGELWAGSVIEVRPTGPTSGDIVWEWHAWDHLVQDYDATKDNYGIVADHPELIDLNYVAINDADWLHSNAVDYNADLDQIMLSVHSFSEIWVIDHSTTSAEAAGHTGGNSGMGGDLLYRWGNPRTYDAGKAADQQLFHQHDAEWIGAGLSGEGNILIFNNGLRRPGEDYSSVDEIALPVNPDGSYSLAAGSAFGPDQPLWTYAADAPTDFYANAISGAQRLPNGNTLICDGPSSYFFEVTSTGETVWEYDHPTGAVFRVERYSPEYPGFDATPLDDARTNQPPIAEAGGPYSGDVGQTITLDGSGSADPDGAIELYEWDLDDDGRWDDASGALAAFTATSVGTFAVDLRVTDDAGATDTDSATVTVTGGSLVLPGTTYAVVDTGQTTFYNNTGVITEPAEGDAFYGQDAQHGGRQPSYTLSADGLTVYDNVTGLTWTQSPDLNGDGEIDVDDKLTFAQAQTYADTLNAQSYGGYSDWRLPRMKELYSLMDFRGTDPSGPAASGAVPFIDTNYFAFGYGDTSAGERIIDAQFWSSNAYVGTVFGGQQATFGLNLADGRIKGYPSGSSGPIAKLNYVYFVRGNTEYGENDLTENGDGTITDNATGLMWSKGDSSVGMDWEDALAWVEQKNGEGYLGHDDWRLPNAKEMQSIVDYTRAPDATGSAAIDPVFHITVITNEGGQADYPWFWTSTTHVRSDGTGSAAVYICFGRAVGYMRGSWMDVHGAGAQRSDPKSGNPDDYPYGHGPQGDVIRIYNYVRLVRDAEPEATTSHALYIPTALG
jgi:hypothetical protein